MPYGPHGGSGVSKGSPHSGGGGGGGKDRHPPAPRPAPRPHTPAPKPAPQPTRAPDFITGRDKKPATIVSPVSYKGPDPISEVVPGDVTPKKTYTPPVRHHGIDTGEEAYEMVGGVKVPLSMRGVKGVDPREDLDRYFEKVEGPDLRTQKEKDEDWEKAQDWDLIKDMSKKGYDFNEIQGVVEKGLTAKTGPRLKSNLIESGLRSLRNVVPETGLEKSLLSRAKSFMPGAKTGLSSLTDKMGSLSQYFNPGKMLTSFALNKMGLGMLNPILGIASLFGFNPFKNMGTKWSGLPTKNQPTMGGRGGDAENVVQASIQKFQPTQSQHDQMTEIMRKRMILQGHADKGALNEQGMNTLQQMNQMISQYQVKPESIFRV